MNVDSSTMRVGIGVPFGDIKNSGNGIRESGTSVAAPFTELKSVKLDYSSPHLKNCVN